MAVQLGEDQALALVQIVGKYPNSLRKLAAVVWIDERGDTPQASAGRGFLVFD